MSVYISGVPLNSTKPMLDGRIVGGSTTTIASFPYQVRYRVAFRLKDTFEVFDHKRPPVFLTTSYSSITFK